jgi:hypothetical protein
LSDKTDRPDYLKLFDGNHTPHTVQLDAEPGVWAEKNMDRVQFLLRESCDIIARHLTEKLDKHVAVNIEALIQLDNGIGTLASMNMFDPTKSDKIHDYLDMDDYV